MDKDRIIKNLIDIDKSFSDDAEFGKKVRQFISDNLNKSGPQKISAPLKEEISSYRDKNGKVVLTKNGEIYGYQG